MSIYIRYPAVGGGGSSGSQTGVPYIVGPLNGAAPSVNGAVIGSFTVYMQSFTETLPGLVSSASQSFGGVKTFISSPIISSLTGPLRANGAGALSVGSISLTSEVVGELPITQTSGSVSLVNKVTGELPITQTSGSVSLTDKVVGILPSANLPPLSGITGSISLTSQVSGILPAANTEPLSSLLGSVSLTGQVSGILPAGNIPPLSGLTGSVSLETQVSGQLPITQTSGSVSLVNKVTGAFPQVTIGSITHSQAAGGATYSVAWPSAQGGASTVLQNNGSGALSWASALTNPMTTSGDLIVGSGSGVVSRKAVGADGTYLKANSTSEQGLQYEYPNGPLTSILTANYTVTPRDSTILCSSASFFITLPLPGSCPAQQFSVYKIDDNINGAITLQTTSSQTLCIGSGGGIITSVQLAGPNDYITVRAVSSSSYAILGSKLTTFVQFGGTNGRGIGPNNIRSFDDAIQQRGNCFTAITGSGTTGCAVTINIPGVYSFSYTDAFGQSEAFGLSLNSNQLSTPVTSLSSATVLATSFTVALDNTAVVSWTGSLKAGDVVRPHLRAGNTNPSDEGRCYFWANRIN